MRMNADKPIKSDDVEAIARTFVWWLRQRKEANPRFATLRVFVNYNFDTTDEVVQQVWETYRNYLPGGDYQWEPEV